MRAELPYLRERYGVERIALYGSFARDEQTEGSDVDLLVDLSRPLGLEFVELVEHLEKALGREPDVATFETLSRSKDTVRYRPVAEHVEGCLTYV